MAMPVDSLLSDSEKVSLEDVLAGRDHRSDRRLHWFNRGDYVLLSLSLLMPGEYKRTLLSRAFMREYLAFLRAQLEMAGFKILAQEALPDRAGDSYLLVFSGQTDPYRLKEFLIAAEEEFTWARAIDLDIYLRGDLPLSRTELSRPERCCLICEDKAYNCSRSRRHSPGELEEMVEKMQWEGFRQLLTGRMQSAAVLSAFSELLVWPKPGLVTGIDPGSHNDMDCFSYAKSIAALTGYFQFAADWGLAYARKRLSENGKFFQRHNVENMVPGTLASLRQAGLRAERRMYAATGGANTHKGFIYQSALLIAAAAAISLEPELVKLSYSKADETKIISSWQGEIRLLAVALEKLAPFMPSENESAGERFQRMYKIGGVRAEAAAGMPAVFNLALPFYRGLSERGLSANDASAITLFLLITVLDDTTLIKRAGRESSCLIRQQIADAFIRMSEADTVLTGAIFINEKVTACSDTPSVDSLKEQMLHPDTLDRIAAEKKAMIDLISLWSDYFTAKDYSAGGAADQLASCLLVLELLNAVSYE